MAVRQPETLSRERASQLVRDWAGGRPGPLGSVLGRVTAVDQVGIELRVDTLKRRSIKKASKLWALDLTIRMMDLTTLEGRDTPGKVRALCAKAMHPQPGDPTIPPVAAVCLYPSLIAEAKDALRGSSVKVASVATAFPAGQTFRRSRSPRCGRPWPPAPTKSTWSSIAAPSWQASSRRCSTRSSTCARRAATRI